MGTPALLGAGDDLCRLYCGSRHGVYRQFHESYQRIPRAPEEAASFQAPTVSSLASLLRKFCGRVLRAAPANAVSITIYELMKITMADPDIKSD